MSHFTDERGTHLNERIILLFNDSMAERLRQTLANNSADFPSEALLELLARQVWAYLEEGQIYLVTRSITIIGRTVQVARGDYAIQIESVSSTNHTIVTQAFRMGVRVEADWEIVTPLRGLPYPTTRGALQLMESIAADDSGSLDIPPAEGVWAQPGDANLSDDTPYSSPEPASYSSYQVSNESSDMDVEPVSSVESMDSEAIIASDNSLDNEVDDRQRMIDELLGRLTNTPNSNDDNGDNIIQSNQDTMEATSDKGAAEETLHSEVIPAFNESKETVPDSQSTDLQQVIHEPSIKADYLAEDQSPSKESDDPQSLVDQWLKNLVGEQTDDKAHESFNEAPILSSSNVELTANDATIVSPETTDDILETSSSSIEVEELQDVVEPMNQEKSENVGQGHSILEEVFPDEATHNFAEKDETNDSKGQAKPPSDLFDFIDLNSDAFADEQQPNTVSSTETYEFLNDTIPEEKPKETKPEAEVSSQSMVDRWIRSLTSGHQKKEALSEGNSPNETIEASDDLSTTTNKEVSVIEDTMIESPPVISVDSSEASQTKDTADFFDHLFSNFSSSASLAKPMESEDITSESIEQNPDLNLKTESLNSTQFNVELELSSVIPYFEPCGKPWIDALNRWHQTSSGVLYWPRMPEMLPVRLVWMASSPEKAADIWSSIKDSIHCRRVLFQDDAILEQSDGDRENIQKELWLEKYRQARINRESEAAKIRILQSQLENIGKSFKDYATCKQELQQLEELGDTAVNLNNVNSSQLNNFKKDLQKVLHKQAELEDKLRNWLFSTREVRNGLSPRYLKMQEEYRELLVKAAVRGRELNDLLTAPTGTANHNSSLDKERAQLSKELSEIDRYIHDTYGKQWKDDQIWSFFEKKDMDGIRDAIKAHEANLALEEKALGNWQNIMEEIPSILFPQIWIGHCSDMNNFMFHQFFPHIIVVEDSSDIDSLSAIPWMVIQNNGNGLYQVEPGQNEAPYDPQLLLGVFGSDEDCRKMAEIVWDQRELIKNGGEFLA